MGFSSMGKVVAFDERSYFSEGDARFRELGVFLNFALAGNATFILRSHRTGRRITYKIQRTTYRHGWLVSLPKTPFESYLLLGRLSNAAVPSFKPVHMGGYCHPATIVFAWFIGQTLSAGRLPSGVDVWHVGRCGRCGRRLAYDCYPTGLGETCERD